MVDDLTLKGLIALQVHGVKERAGGEQIHWKNIRIQTGQAMKPSPLDKTTPVANYMINTLSPQEKAQGVTLLFNGKDLSGWRSANQQTPPAQGWKVENGVLQVLPEDKASGLRWGDLLTVKNFTSFELTFDFKLTEGANSGVKYFVTTAAGSKSGLGLEPGIGRRATS